MAHFAELDENNIVKQVIVIPNEEEYRGQEFINNELNLEGVWIQTSYNTRGGIHYNSETNEPSSNQSKSFRKNYAAIGYSYDEERDAFIAPKPEEFPSFIFNENKCVWEPPVPKPNEEGFWMWNEELLTWMNISEKLNEPVIE